MSRGLQIQDDDTDENRKVSFRRLLSINSVDKRYRIAILGFPSGIILLILGIILVAQWMKVIPASAKTSELQAGIVAIDEGRVGPEIEMADLSPYSPGETAGITRKIEIHTAIPERPRMQISQYSVQQGDTIFGIAEEYGLQPETILWGNYSILEDNPHSLRPGQDLNILPVDGTYYEWFEGDSLTTVASFFGVEPQEIIDWPGNNLSPSLDYAAPDIAEGTAIMIPGGAREFVSWQAPRITRGNPAVASVSGPGACGSIYDGPVGEGFFLWPTAATDVSGYGYSSFHPGIDIAGSTGNAIFASASGVVVYAGWNNYGYGYMVVIDHGDGWQTLYAHMSKVNVGCGQAAFQGNVIGAVGSSGNSSGSHLHFEMQSDAYGKVNPYNFVSP